MLDFDKMMAEINKDIETSEQASKPVSLEEQEKRITESVDKLNEFANNVSEEFSKKFQEMHELYFNNEPQNTQGSSDNNADNNGDIIE